MVTNSIGILHISDSHFDKTNVIDIDLFIDGLILDVKELLSSKEFKINFLCFTGDLIKAGDDSLFDEACELIISKIKNELSINSNNILFVPGNHEVDIEKIEESFEHGLENEFEDPLKIDKITRKEKEYIDERMGNRSNFRPLSEVPQSNKNIESFIFSESGLNIGFCCINTAWFSKGKSLDDKKRIMLSRRDLQTEYDLIKDCDIKICLMHHPMEWIRHDYSPDINTLLNKYDLILCGHEHEVTNIVSVHANGRTLISKSGQCTASKEDNGYTLFRISTDNLECNVFSRKYYSTRGCFDSNLKVGSNGQACYTLNRSDPKKQKLFEIYNNTKSSFHKNLDELFIINLLESGSGKTFDDLFIMPKLLKKSYYGKEKHGSEKYYAYERIVFCGKNLNFYGKKEIGKTTLAYKISKDYYENFSAEKRIPVVIDIQSLNTSGGISFIEKEIKNQLETDTFSLTIEQIKEQLVEGNFVVIFDNYNEHVNKIEKIREFTEVNCKNRFIYFREEKPINQKEEGEILSLLNTNQNEEIINVFLGPMSKHLMRQMVYQQAQDADLEVDLFLDRLVHYFYDTNLPRTPFLVSLIIAVCNQKSDFVPVNQAKILEQFMEILLEKLSKEEIKRQEYDFENKESYLAFLAFEMI